MSLIEFSLRLALALICGAAIGFERQWQHKSAGLRTNTLVAVGAAIYVLLSIQLTETSGDTTRIVGQIVTGIGFLGAGVILHEGPNVFGLTTAATIWCSSAVGCFAGAGYYMEAALSTVIIIAINYGLIGVDNWLKKRQK